MLRAYVPLGIFLLLLVLLAAGLDLNPSEIPSPLVDKPAPAFTLPLLHAPEGNFSPQEMLGEVWLLNVWASWCVACRDEHPVLVKLAASGKLPVLGLNYKDRRENARAWLKRHGDPYERSAVDADGRVAINYGVYGVPETYLIDREGTIRFKQIGPVTNQVLRETILPMAQELRQ